MTVFTSLFIQILALTSIDVDSLHSADYFPSSTRGVVADGYTDPSSTTTSVVAEDRMCTAPSLHVMAEEAKKGLTNNEQVDVSCVMPQVGVCREIVVLFYLLGFDVELQEW